MVHEIDEHTHTHVHICRIKTGKLPEVENPVELYLKDRRYKQT